ncbi:MATE family efflux transporter [Clostridium sp. UBA1056]|uniref:MATE family efflux transporter n=1 Tax=unclassified Clostridium TaxID=2614128 RepID=UPI003217DAC4
MEDGRRFFLLIQVFIGQNYGARNYDKVEKVYYKGIKLVGIIGTLANLILIFAREPIFKMFTLGFSDLDSESIDITNPPTISFPNVAMDISQI